MPLGIVMLTYNRRDYAERTLESVLKNLVWPHGIDVFVHIGSDGDSDEYINNLTTCANDFSVVKRVTHSNSHGRGYGASYNLSMKLMHSDCSYVLVLEDDWECLRDLDIDGLCHDMFNLKIGCCRLGYIGYTRNLTATFVRGEFCPQWLLFDPRSEEAHIFCGHPRIESRDWSKLVGKWPEGIPPGETEIEVAGRRESRVGVGWPVSYVNPSGDLFKHIGEVRSYDVR